MVLSYSAGVKGTRVDGATVSVGGEEFRKSGVKVIRDEGRDYVLVAIGNDKEVMRTSGVEVVLPSWAREYAWLGASGTQGTSLCISIHRFGCQFIGFSLLVQDYGHGQDRGRGTRRNVFNKGRDDGGSVHGVGCGGDWGRDRHAVMKVRGRNGKWLRTGNRRTVKVGWVDIVCQFSPWVCQG